MHNQVDQSRELISYLHKLDHHPISSCFFDEAFAEWFKAFVADNQIVECYLYSTPANFMLINEPGDIFWLSVGSETELEEEIDWAEDQYEDAEDTSAKSLIDDIKAKGRILFFPDYHENIQPLAFPEWEHIAHPCEKLTLKNGNTYYYAFFADKAPYTIKQTALKTYGMYLDEVLG